MERSGYIDSLSLAAICIPDIFVQHVLRKMEYCALVSHSVPRQASCFHKKALCEIVATDTPDE